MNFRPSSVVTLAEPGWVSPRDVEVGELSAAFRTNGAARCSFTLPAKQAASLGFADPKGKWVFASLGPLGNWSGTIEDNPGDVGSQIVELNAVDFTGRFDTITTPRTYKQDAGPPGALMLRAIRDSGVDNGLWLTSATADEDGLPVTVEWRGDPLGRVISTLANAGGGITRVTTTDRWAVNWEYLSAPEEQRRSILLVDGYNAADGSVRPSLSQVVNDLLGIANDAAWQKASGARVTDGDSIAAYDRRQATKRYVGHTRASSIEGVARADLARLALPVAAVSVEVPITDPVLLTLRVGQLVNLWSGTVNARYDLTVTGIAYDSTRRTATVVGTGAPQA